MTSKLCMSIIISLLLLLSTADAIQRRPRIRQRPPQTKAQPTPTATPAPTPQDAALSLEAGLIFKSGDVKPVARTMFYLLDEHPGKILKQAGVKPSYTGMQIDYDDPDNMVFVLGLALRTPALPESQAFVKVALPAITPHIVQNVTTDFNGKAEFAAVKVGTYYLMGFAELGRASAEWNLKLDLKAGRNSVTLDNNNASHILNQTSNY